MIKMSKVVFLVALMMSAMTAEGRVSLQEAQVGMPLFVNSPTPLEITSNSPEFTTISLQSPPVQMQQVSVNYQNYTSFGMAGEPWMPVEGAPAVPQVSRLYRIPNTGGAELHIAEAEYEILNDVDVLPFQWEAEGFEGVQLDQAIYSADQWFPANVAEMSDPMIMRDFRVVQVSLYPVQVNPVTRQVRVYQTLNVEIVANDNPAPNELLNPRRPTGSWIPTYQSVIANLDETALLDATTTPGSILIITSTSALVTPWADSLAFWKRRRGWDVTIDARTTGQWSVTAMRNAIQTAYSTWDPPLEHVILMGGPEWSNVGVQTDGGNYDHTFALGNNGDDLEDIGCGRLSGTTEANMATINAKIMAYERNPNLTDTQWYTKAFLYAGVANNIASNFTLMQWTAHQFETTTGVVNCTVAQVNGHVDDNLVRTQLNGGVGYFFWRGSWLGQMESSLAPSCNNGDRLPVVMCVTCGANEFVSGMGTAESYLLAGSVTQLKGGVAGIGTSTSGTHAPPNGTFAGGLLYAITTLHIEHLGHALNSAKVWLPLSFGVGSSEASNFTRWNNLMGDPSLSLWTETPTVMSVTHENTLATGTRSMVFDIVDDEGIPVEDALIVLWKGAETYERALTNAQGHAEVPCNVETAGDMLLTITKRNHAPYLRTLVCSQSAAYAALARYSIDDDNAGGTSGNNNGIVNPGEIIDLPTYIKNSGASLDVNNVTAQLTSSSNQVTVITGNASYGTIAAGDSALGSVPFRVQIAPTIVHEQEVLMTLVVQSSAGTTRSAFNLAAEAGRADYQTSQFQATFNPGVTTEFRVTLRNGGILPLNTVTATIESQSPFVSVDDANGTFGTIAPGATAVNTADPFVLRANSLAFRGHVAPMLVRAVTSDGHVDSVRFAVSVGNATAADPTGPDAFGYYAYDNTDAAYEMHPDFNYVDISAGQGTNLNIADSGEKNSTSQIWSTARALPFSFKYYDVEFDSITVCSNGWAAFGQQPWNDGFRNFPIPAQQAPDAMLAVYWDDLKTQGTGLGVWHYFDAANHRYIIQWKATGAFNSTPLNFEIILYDEEFYPTFDGNGNILFQYQTVTINMAGEGGEALGQSIGIQAPAGVMGLPINYQAAHTPGSATVNNGRAILFTTQARMLFGDLVGVVRDAETMAPMQGVRISLDGENYQAFTDAQGRYTMPDILIGTFTLRTQFARYNDATVEDVVVELDSVDTVDVLMLHPEFTLSTDTISVRVPEQPNSTTYDIINDGNGPLDYALDITYAGDVDPDPWNLLSDDVIDVTGTAGDPLINGVEFVGDFWWVSGGNGPGGQNLLYKYDLDGNLVGSLTQPSTSAWGWFDMAWDGTRLYGGQDDDPYITGINLTTGEVEDRIPVPLNPARAIAYDPATQSFWMADYTSDLFKVSREGQILQQVANEGAGELAITGLAWRADDPVGYKLYIFSQNGTSALTRVTRMNTTTLAREHVIDLEANPGERAGGCTITGGWNSTLLVFGAVLQGQGQNGDRIGIYEVDFNTTWINVTPTATTVPGGTHQTVNVVFDPLQLRPAVYRVNVNMHSMVLDTTITLPVILTVNETDVPNSEAPVITEYALHQNYPNPFNPTTAIRYDLKEAGRTTLEIFNINGQLVATLFDGMQTAGSHLVSFDGATLGSGVYFYRLQSGEFVRSAKMVLLK